MSLNNTDTRLTVVVPVYNEVEYIERFIQRLKDTFAASVARYEIIFVDNSSIDGSGDLLRKVFTREQNLKVITLSRNFGQMAAILSAGAYVSGNIVVIMDIDLQVSTDEMPKLIAKLNEGFDVVLGYRSSRKDSFFRVVSSYVMNRIINYKVGVKIIDWGCAYSCTKADVFQSLVPQYGVNARFAKPLIVKENKNHIAQVAVTHVPREYGPSRYNAGSLFRMAFDFILNFPVQLEKKEGEVFTIKEVLSR